MSLDDFLEEWNSPSDSVMLQTSGSTGAPKRMRAEKSRMRASALMTCRFLGLRRGDSALLCMSTDYIAGKMMVVRSLVGGLRLVSVEPSGHPLRGLDTAPDFAAMIPMQVFNSMQEPREREMLMQIGNLIIGGGSVDEALEAQLRRFPNAVWSTYGMTETLSHIALRRLSGDQATDFYTPFDGVSVNTDADGCLVIDAPAVCPEVLTTNDVAVIEPDGRRFRILGRKDNVICCAGIKTRMEDIERQLGGHIAAPYMVTKKKDARFGEIIVLLVQADDTSSARNVCRAVLPKYQQPRLYIKVKELPLTPTGKPARAEAMKIAERHDAKDVDSTN